MDYFDNFLERIVEAVDKDARMCETAFHINFATTDVRPNTAMNVDKKKSEIFTFPAHKIIPFIENHLQQDENFEICDEFKNKWQNKFIELMNLILKNIDDELLENKCKAICGEEIKSEHEETKNEVNIVASIPNFLRFKFDYKYIKFIF